MQAVIIIIDDVDTTVKNACMTERMHACMHGIAIYIHI